MSSKNICTVPLSESIEGFNLIGEANGKLTRLPYKIIDEQATQGDWSQNDTTKPDHILNRPFYEVKNTYFPKQTFETELNYIHYMLTSQKIIHMDSLCDPTKEYIITLNGVETKCKLLYGYYNYYEGYYFVPLDFAYTMDDYIPQEEICAFGTNDSKYCILTMEYTNYDEEDNPYTVPVLMIWKESDESEIVTLEIANYEIKQLESKFIPNMADWDQNNKNGVGYIENRTHWKEPTGEYFLLLDSSFEIENQYGWSNENNILGEPLVEGETYFVTLDDVEYKCVAFDDGNGSVCIGNLDLPNGNEVTSGEPFFIFSNGNETEGYQSGICFLNSGSHYIYLARMDYIYHKIDKNYLPEMSSVGKSGTNENAEVFNDYVNNTATGYGSHAEGGYTSSSGYYSHAEGGYTSSSGNGSHTEGMNTLASGLASHAEGSYNHATEDNTHAEGEHTIASARASHTEGYYTLASSENQHVQGKYNIEDTANKYAHIVGNGESDTARSNAHTLDWNGNAWYAGTVEGSYFILSSSSEGSTKRFTITVDDAGTLTATEIVE